MLPVVMSLKGHPDRAKLVPASLQHYFDEHIVVSGWYPERDYFILLEALVRTIDPKTVGGDVWRYFAQFSVKRDIGGADTGVTSAPGRGVYRNFAAAAVGSPEQLLVRGTKLWSQYHDTGTMRVAGKRAHTNVIVMQLTGFHIPVEGFVRLQGYYLEEYGRLVGVELESGVTRSTARGAPLCEWEHTLAPSPAADAYLASLPVVTRGS